MKRVTTLKFLAFILFFGFVVSLKADTDILTESITKENLEFLPVTADFRNYFILQSIDDTTNIIIADFVGAEKVLSLTIEKNGEGKINRVYEYFPDVKKFTRPRVPSTRFFSDLETVKKTIIDGSIYKVNYAYKMFSVDTLKARIESGRDIYKTGKGYSVKIYDPDSPSTIMAEYFFGRENGRYNLQFKTYYYKLFKTKIIPPLSTSVYCKNSKDPMVKATVEELIGLMEK